MEADIDGTVTVLEFGAERAAVADWAGPPLGTRFGNLPKRPPPPDPVVPPPALGEAAAIFARHGLAPEGEPLVPAPVSATCWAAPFNGRPGVCYGFAAVERGDGAIELFRLTDQEGRELARWTGPAAPARLARCVFGQAEELILEVVGPSSDLDVDREPPVIAVFAAEAAATVPPLPRP
jgi:hypothetical protein